MIKFQVIRNAGFDNFASDVSKALSEGAVLHGESFSIMDGEDVVLCQCLLFFEEEDIKEEPNKIIEKFKHWDTTSPLRSCDYYSKKDVPDALISEEQLDTMNNLCRYWGQPFKQYSIEKGETVRAVVEVPLAIYVFHINKDGSMLRVS